METSYDIINANLYADNLAFEYQFNKFLKSHPHIFRHCEVENRPATNDDYYIPPAIANQCKVFKATFNKIGCEKIACFPKVQRLENCSPIDRGRIIPIGNGFTYACQPACSQISKDIDTEFREGKCFMANPLKKMFALFPEHILGTKIRHSLFTGLDYKQNLRLNENYCKYYGLEFNPETFDCYETTGQTIGEFLLGTTFFRSMKRIAKPLAPIKLNVSLPNYLKNVDEWLESNKRVKRQIKENEIDDSDDDGEKNVAFEIAKEMAVDFGIELSLSATANLFRKRIPRFIQKFGNRASLQLSKVTKNALMDIVLRSHISTTLKLSKFFGATLKTTSYVFAAISIGSLIVDLYDPYNFNQVLTTKALNQINKRLDFAYFESNNTSVEVTPDRIWPFLEKDLSDYLEFRESKLEEYLESLTDDTYETRLKIQSANYNHPQKDYVKIIHFIIVFVLIFLSATFIENIFYITFLFFILLLYSSPVNF